MVREREEQRTLPRKYVVEKVEAQSNRVKEIVWAALDLV
jgi:hypothetical protein